MSIPFFTLFKKPLNSISDEITTKFKTPFFTTYITVWIIKNNLFTYNLFFNTKIIDKTNLLQTQFNLSEFSFYKEILITLLITLSVLIIFYVFFNIARIITMFSEERIKLNLLNSLKSKTITSVDDTNYWKKKSNDLNGQNRDLEEEINSLRSSHKYYKNQLETEQKKVIDTIENCDKTVKKMKTIVTVFSNSIGKTTDKNTISKLVDSIDREQTHYENFKKPRSFIVS